MSYKNSILLKEINYKLDGFSGNTLLGKAKNLNETIAYLENEIKIVQEKIDALCN